MSLTYTAYPALGQNLPASPKPRSFDVLFEHFTGSVREDIRRVRRGTSGGEQQHTTTVWCDGRKVRDVEGVTRNGTAEARTMCGRLEAGEGGADKRPGGAD